MASRIFNTLQVRGIGLKVDETLIVIAIYI